MISDQSNQNFFIPQLDRPGQTLSSSAQVFGALIKQELKSNPNFYLFSPDETTSNRLSAVYETAARAWANLPTLAQDLPSSVDGHIIELLSENVLFATMQGHLFAAKPAIMTSYEAFFAIITSQIIQHLKFLDQSIKTSWRPAYPAANLLSTSTCWRQDHNGFSHQSPALISTLLAHPGQNVNCLFPVDDVAAHAAYRFMLSSQNVVNLTTFNKIKQPRWLDSHQARQELKNGASIFKFISDENPDIIFTAAGDIPVRESIYAMQLLRHSLPNLKLRFVNLAALTHNAIGTTNSKLDQSTFDQYFGTTQPIIANFHAYPDTLKQILSNYTDPSRITAHGFIEQGSTTTPFEMLSLNQTSRYHLAISAAKLLNQPDLITSYQNILKQNSIYAQKHGVDRVSEIIL